ncbi:MAG TPA: hypothetical protein PKB00_06425 [Microthrixaceae bacterium]|nr:hypothetical protein [Microthrixaceae bacterium]HNB58685.1 hypothetical protein [Phycisphaerales bacterium]
MAPRLTLAEVWSDLQAAGGTALGLIPDPGSVIRTRSVPNAGDNEIAVTLRRESSAWAYLRETRVVRLVFSNGTVEEYRIQSFDEEAGEDGLTSSFVAAWPDVDLANLAPVSRTEADGSTVFTFEAVGLTVAQHLSQFILPSLAAVGATWFVAGTIDPTQPVDMVYDKVTPLAALLQLCAAITSSTTGQPVEFSLRRASDSQWAIDVLNQIGASAPRLYLQAGKNLVGVKRSRDAVPMMTRATAIGAEVDGVGATIANAVWKVASAPTGTTIRLVDPVGGPGPVLEDDQLNGLYVQKYPGGAWVQVSDSALANHEVTTAAAHGLVANDLVRFASGSAGQALTTLTSPSAEALYQKTHRFVARPDIAGTVNLLTNPGMRQYTTGSNAAPDSWAVTYPSGASVTRLSVNAVDKETTAGRWRSGGQSARVVTVNDGDGIETAYATLDLTDARPFASGFGGFWNDTDGAKVRVQVVLGKGTVSISGTPTRSTSGGITTASITTSSAHGLAVGDLVEVLGIVGGTVADGWNGIRRVSRVASSTVFEYQLSSDPGAVSVVSSPTARPVFVFKTSGNGASKVWNDLGWQNCCNAGGKTKDLGVTVGKVQIVQDGATGATLYIDRAQLTVGAGEGNLPFLEGSGGVQLWQALNLALASGRAPSVRYDGTMLDLGRLDPVRWPNDDITLGGPVDVDDPRWGIDVSTRVLQVKQVLAQSGGGVEGVASVVLSNRDGDLSDELRKAARPSAPQPPIPGPKRRVVPYIFQAAQFVPKTSTDAANLRYNLAGGATQGLFPLNAATALASANITNSLKRGATIVGIVSDISNTGGGAGTVKLYRDGTLVTTLTQSGAALESNMTLSQAISGEGFWLEASLQQISSTIFSFLTYVTVYVEEDDNA